VAEKNFGSFLLGGPGPPGPGPEVPSQADGLRTHWHATASGIRPYHQARVGARATATGTVTGTHWHWQAGSEAAARAAVTVPRGQRRACPLLLLVVPNSGFRPPSPLKETNLNWRKIIQNSRAGKENSSGILDFKFPPAGPPAGWSPLTQQE
jgi:hypothetical protein